MITALSLVPVGYLDVSQPTQAPWWCPMCGPGGMWGWGMMFGWLLWLVVLAFLVWLAVRYLPGRAGPPGRGADAEAILKERYARGEIDRDTYLRMLEDLRRQPPV
ncbi:MAG TPA: SHOCT domain-containing protein [Longimicrobiales bacterium]|nr:SHOCT domain-containing protein [Longimicrobiales bacterium]